MKRVVLSFFSVLVAVSMFGQVAQWLIPAKYDNMKLDTEAGVIVADSAGIKVTWNLDGKRLFATENDVAPFTEGMAVAKVKGSNFIAGVYKANGTYIPLEGFTVAHNHPFYSHGNLVVCQNNIYRLINKNGEVQPEIFAMLYPYFNGYAAGHAYLNKEKLKDPYPVLINALGNPVIFSYNDKLFKPDEVDFASSVNDEKKGVVVIKKKVYIFNGADGTITPVFASKNAIFNPKDQAKLEGEVEKCLLLDPDTNIYTLFAKCGKLGQVTFRFDKMMRLLSVKRTDSEQVYKAKAPEVKEFSSSLRVFAENNLEGILSGSETMLPAQFDKVIKCFDDKAIVSLKGRCGMISIDKSRNFTFRLNKGDDIPFRHQKYETTLRADMPAYIGTDDIMLDVTGGAGCELDIATKASRSTDAGNFVQYNCSLSIPANITDELTPINYSVVVSYDGLKSAPIPLNVKAWHYKYFVVEIDDAQTTVDKGLVTFAFTINAERLPGDGVYHTTVDIVADSLQYELEKMSETAYKCRLAGLASGVNKIAVKILEQGCPPVIFPYEVYYTPAKGRSRSSAATPEEVTIMRSTTKRLKITRPVIIETAPAEPEPAAPAPVEETVAEPAPSIPSVPSVPTQGTDDPSQEYKRKVMRN